TTSYPANGGAMRNRTNALIWFSRMVGFLALFAISSAVNSASSAGYFPPPIPPSYLPHPGPLARPRSTQQVGLPIGQTRAAIPSDNPQTPEKIALGEKL